MTEEEKEPEKPAEKAAEEKPEEPAGEVDTVDAIAKRVAALDEGDELERIAREEEAKLAARRKKQRGANKGVGGKSLESAASKRLAKIGEKAKPIRAIPDAVEAADPLIERTQKLGEWARKNRNIVQGAIVAAVVAGIAAGIYFYLDHKKANEASVALALAVADERGEIGDPDKEDEDAIHEKIPIFRSVDDRREAALAKYREVETKFKGTGAAWLARLGEGSLLLDKRDPDGAISAFEDVLTSNLAKADGEVRGRALENLGFAYELRAENHPDERDKNLDKALEQYKQLETSDVFGFKQIAPYHQARCYELKGDKTKAVETLKTLREDLMKSQDSRLFGTLRDLTDDRLRQLDPTAAPAKRNKLGAGGGQLSPEMLEKLPPEIRERFKNGVGGGGGNE